MGRGSGSDVAHKRNPIVVLLCPSEVLTKGMSDQIAPATVSLTSVGVTEYSLVLSTETMLVSSSLDILTSQFNSAVTYRDK